MNNEATEWVKKPTEISRKPYIPATNCVEEHYKLYCKLSIKGKLIV